jgi:hypothetical protein
LREREESRPGKERSLIEREESRPGIGGRGHLCFNPGVKNLVKRLKLHKRVPLLCWVLADPRTVILCLLIVKRLNRAPSDDIMHGLVQYRSIPKIVLMTKQPSLPERKAVHNRCIHL